MSEPIVVQIRTGKAKEMGEEGAKHPMDRPWKSAIYKQPITGERLLTELGLKQDEVGDPVAHGGAEKALCLSEHPFSEVASRTGYCNIRRRIWRKPRCRK